jgi:hypothetical protein
MPSIVGNSKQLAPEEQFHDVFDDFKLKTSLIGLADKYTKEIQDFIYKTYTDPHINSIYRGIRNSSVFEKGSKSKVHRKIVQFPNAYVFDFVDTVMKALYDEDWLYNNKALKHELVRPWWVVNKI